MLYQTLPLFSLLNPSPSSSSSSSSSPSPLPSRRQENPMDCVANKALKTSFWPENVLKQTQQVFVEDFWSGNGGNGVSGDDLFVDGLLDFSNEDGDKGLVENEQLEHEKHEKVSLEEQEEFQSNNSNSSLEFGSSLLNPPSEELSVPVEEVENLEWLSHFVDDSFSEFSLQIPVEQKLLVPKQNRSEPEPPVNKTGFLSSVPAKARSKRSRTGGRVWSMGSLPLTDSSCSASSSSSYSSSSSSSCLIFDQTGSGSGSGRDFEMFTYLEKPPRPKKKRKGPIPDTQPRRCSHCGVNKTPQWRTGPMGAKTLCNACGVRYKSGRLLPEYRPACSPTFSSEVHSNNHRKVLEMRRMKESSTMGHFQPVAPGLNFRYC